MPYNGLEIDMLSLGDADCIVVTQWAPVTNQTNQSLPHRILIDGGNSTDFPIVRNFLLAREMTHFWAAICTHPHKDHASGLIKLVQDRTFTFQNGWMHDIRNHLPTDALRRASAGTSQQADAVKQVVETTKELAGAFAARGIATKEPFAGEFIAGYPPMVVLGPSRPFYQQAIGEFTNVELPALLGYEALLTGLGGLSTTLSADPYFALGSRVPVPLAGLLKTSSVLESPTTQPFNNTSTILGIVFDSQMFLLTADAGSDALDGIPPSWKSVLWMQVPHHGSDGNLSQTNIERFCPKYAHISARGSTNHPSRAIVNGLIKAGASVCSTHLLTPGHLWFHLGNVPPRADYGAAAPLKGTSNRDGSYLARLALSGIG